MKRFFKQLFFVMTVSFCFSAVECAKIKITCRSKGRELELCKKAVDEWIKLTGNEHEVEIITLPHSSNECFALYQQWLSAESFDVDILQMDVAWIGVFADHFADLRNYSRPKEIDIQDYFGAIRKSMYCFGKLVALPWYTDCGIMYYRSDLLKKYGKPVPKTWQELYETALYIQNEERKDERKKNKFYGFVFQAKAFECLTCNVVEFIDSFGGEIIENKKVAINSQRCVDAIQFMVDCLKNITSSSVLNCNEEDSRGMFQSGNALFMRNWPYAWSLLNSSSTEVAGNVGVMPIPPSKNGGKPSGVLGGWFLSVSKYSKHISVAADLVKFLTSKEQQRLRSEYSYLPAFQSLYSDPYVLKKNPFFAKLYDSLENAVTRPSIAFERNYSRSSTEIFNTVNTILTESVEGGVQKTDVRKYLDRLKRKMENILNKPPQEKKKTGKGFLTKIKEFLLGIFN